LRHSDNATNAIALRSGNSDWTSCYLSHTAALSENPCAYSLCKTVYFVTGPGIELESTRYNRTGFVRKPRAETRVFVNARIAVANSQHPEQFVKLFTDIARQSRYVESHRSNVVIHLSPLPFPLA
jgi:hypothetical protein